MSQLTRFRYVNEIAGAFVLLAAALLIAGVVMSSVIQGKLRQVVGFEVMLPADGTHGIQAGSEVHLMGSLVGTVSQIVLRNGAMHEIEAITDVDPNDVHLWALLEVQEDRIPFIGSDSRAELKFDLGGFGAPYFEITRGSEPRDPDQHILPLTMSGDVKDGLTKAVDEISEAIIPVLKEIEASTEKIGDLAESLSKPDGALQSVLIRTESLLASVEAGEGMAGVFLKDEAAGSDLQTSMANARATTDELKKAMQDIQLLTSRLNEKDGTVGALLNDESLLASIKKTVSNLEAASAGMERSLDGIPELLNRTEAAMGEYTQTAVVLQQTLIEYQTIAKAMQEHWLIRGNVRKVKAVENGEATVVPEADDRRSNNRIGSGR